MNAHFFNRFLETYLLIGNFFGTYCRLESLERLERFWRTENFIPYFLLFLWWLREGNIGRFEWICSSTLMHVRITSDVSTIMFHCLFLLEFYLFVDSTLFLSLSSPKSDLLAETICQIWLLSLIKGLLSS